MDITLNIGGRDFSSRLSTYNVTRTISYGNTITTLDGHEHVGKRVELIEINFSLFPAKESTAMADYAVLSERVFAVTFTDPLNGATISKNFRVANDIESVFGFKNINSDRIYEGAEITLRETVAS